ncbi:MAG: bifunctional hydroxymethylpyrimidine kinase/phosphomethylpyrimidine kinase [Lachnospiraceae bacterium]|nr:bifunctional hydroxymethylpyrimidine kinase/phosphomethylpyrimidine kinase [Lachnospiraceae bacterium]
MKKVLTIAGSDCSGGAGIQADIKTITAHGLYAMSVITAITAQNTTRVSSIESISPKMVKKQLESVFWDIFPDAVKIGMVQNQETIQVIAENLEQYCPKHVVVDTVMVSTSGKRLLEESAISALKEKLIPLADIITPNIPEAQVLSNVQIRDKESRIQAAKKIAQNYKGAVLIKGGHDSNNADDLLYQQGNVIWYESPRIDNQNTHGTGCTLSSGIACGLAQGYSMEESVAYAKEYITGALQAGLDLGQGAGPLNHMWRQTRQEW